MGDGVVAQGDEDKWLTRPKPLLGGQFCAQRSADALDPVARSRFSARPRPMWWSFRITSLAGWPLRRAS